MMTEKATVLVVDDELFNRDILAEYLEDAGYRVIQAEDGSQAIERLAAHPEIDIVVLDRMMPDMDGLEVLKHIKRDPERGDLPVIMQTAAAASRQVLEGIQAGAFYYLTKPYEKAMLLAIVEAARSDQRQMRDMREALLGQQNVLVLLDQARFRFRTLEEAKSLSHLVAGCCPEPLQVVYGLCELMINAIEHGNLGISYADKTALLAAGTWHLEVDRRLALPENRHRYAVLEFEAEAGQLVIVIRDEGTGFDWREYLEIRPDRAGDLHGRGVAMARAISFSSLNYLGVGNTVVCTVPTEPSRSPGRTEEATGRHRAPGGARSPAANLATPKA